MSTGYLCLVLHTHLPFSKHHESEQNLEETWLLEAVSESYIPLLRMLYDLLNEGVGFRVAITISPTLSAMLEDSGIQQKIVQHLENQISMGEKEKHRLASQPEQLKLATDYHKRYRDNLSFFKDCCHRQIIRTFKELQTRGVVELLTTSATHSFLPLLQHIESAVNLQTDIGMNEYSRVFSCKAKGFWLPECGYFPGLEEYLVKYGAEYSIVPAHAFLYADQPVKYGSYSPIKCPNDLAMFCIDLRAVRSVSAKDQGYASDIVYRDFEQDAGFVLPLNDIKDFTFRGGIRTSTGYSYYAKQSRYGKPVVFQKDKAFAKAGEHAENFIYMNERQIQQVGHLMDRPPVILCPFVTQFFGRWWFEGLHWLEQVIRKTSNSRSIEMITPSDYLGRHPDLQTATPGISSWGNGGYAQMWLDQKNDWLYRHVHRTALSLEDMAVRHTEDTGIRHQAMNQAFREALLSQASDWPFIMKTSTTPQYAEQRIAEHIHNFNTIKKSLSWNNISPKWLAELSQANRIFPNINYKSYLTNKI